jgi:hypothetical protein
MECKSNIQIAEIQLKGHFTWVMKSLGLPLRSKKQGYE